MKNLTTLLFLCFCLNGFSQDCFKHCSDLNEYVETFNGKELYTSRRFGNNDLIGLSDKECSEVIDSKGRSKTIKWVVSNNRLIHYTVDKDLFKVTLVKTVYDSTYTFVDSSLVFQWERTQPFNAPEYFAKLVGDKVYLVEYIPLDRVGKLIVDDLSSERSVTITPFNFSGFDNIHCTDIVIANGHTYLSMESDIMMSNTSLSKRNLKAPHSNYVFDFYEGNFLSRKVVSPEGNYARSIRFFQSSSDSLSLSCLMYEVEKQNMFGYGVANISSLQDDEIIMRIVDVNEELRNIKLWNAKSANLIEKNKGLRHLEIQFLKEAIVLNDSTVIFISQMEEFVNTSSPGMKTMPGSSNPGNGMSNDALNVQATTAFPTGEYGYAGSVIITSYNLKTGTINWLTKTIEKYGQGYDYFVDLDTSGNILSFYYAEAKINLLKMDYDHYKSSAPNKKRQIAVFNVDLKTGVSGLRPLFPDFNERPGMVLVAKGCHPLKGGGAVLLTMNKAKACRVKL